MSELERLARAGGARWVNTIVTRYLQAARTSNGAAPQLPPVALQLLAELERCIGAEPNASEFGQVSGTVSIAGFLPVAAAAAEIGCGERRVRRAIASGRVRCHRPGPHATLVDVDGLRRHIAETDRRTA